MVLYKNNGAKMSGRRYGNISTLKKFEARMRQIPNDISFSELNTYLINKGYVHTAGNPPHYVFTYDQNGIKEIINLAAPHGTSDGVKPIYIRKILESIDRL